MAEDAGELVARARLFNAREESRGPAKKSRPAELVALLEDLRSAPPEFAASELVRIASFRIKNDKDWQRELLEEAFGLARLAQQPYKRPIASTELAGWASLAKAVAELAMDRLSLQCAAIQALLEIDPPRALDLVNEIELALPVTNCQEVAGPNVDIYYQTLLAVAKRCFNREQQEKSEDLAFLEAHLRQINHPAQVAPASRLVRFYGTTSERLEPLLSAFLTALDGVRQDDRTFSNGGNVPAATELQSLGIFCTQYSKRGAEVFARLRRYLVEHLNGPRCADNVLTFTGKTLPLPQAIRDFNQLIALDSYKIEEIAEEEIKPGPLGGRAQSPRYWETPKAANLKQRFYDLMIGKIQPRVGAEPNEPLRLIPPDPTSPEHLQALQEFFAELKDWEPEENVAPSDHYQQQCLLYGESFRRMPASTLRNQVLRDYVNLLAGCRSQFKSFPEWYAHFKALLSGYVMAEVQGTMAAAKDAVESSPDPFIQLFVRLNSAVAQK